MVAVPVSLPAQTTRYAAVGAPMVFGSRVISVLPVISSVKSPIPSFTMSAASGGATVKATGMRVSTVSLASNTCAYASVEVGGAIALVTSVAVPFGGVTPVQAFTFAVVEFVSIVFSASVSLMSLASPTTFTSND